METVLDEVAQEFDGEAPLVSAVRRILDKTRQDLVALQSLLSFVDVEAELPEPDEERVAQLRERLLRHDTWHTMSDRTCQKFRHLDPFETFWHDAGAGPREAMRRLGILVLALAGLAALLAGCGGGKEEEASTARY